MLKEDGEEGKRQTFILCNFQSQQWRLGFLREKVGSERGEVWGNLSGKRGKVSGNGEFGRKSGDLGENLGRELVRGFRIERENLKKN